MNIWSKISYRINRGSVALDKFFGLKRVCFWGGFVIGIIVFILTFGISCLNVTNDDWILLGDHDFIQAYLGWLFYRNSDSIVGITNWVYEHEASIIYTDGMPIAMLFFKMFEKVLPSTFQYFGIVTCLQFGLQGGFTALCVHEKINKWEGIIAVAIFSCMNPVVLYRCYGHFSLSMHWILLAAFCLWKYREVLGRKVYFLWIALFLIGSMTHLYFIPIVAIIYGGNVLHDILCNKKKNSIKWLFTLLCSALLCVSYGYVFGVFGNELSSGANQWSYEHLSESNANLNTFVNPTWCSNFFESLGNCYSYQANEGFAYLGIGIISMLLLTMVVRLFQKERRPIYDRKELIAIIVCAVVSVVAAVGFKLCWGTKELFVIPIPECIKGILATFRSIGRYIWPAYYIILLSIVGLFSNCFLGKRRWLGCVLLLVLILLQRFDCDKLYDYRYESANASEQYVDAMSDERWTLLAQDHEVVVMYPEFASSNSQYISMAKYILENDMTITSSVLAHENNVLEIEAEERYADLANGKVMENAIYWFAYEGQMLYVADKLHCEMIDGYYVGWKEE